VEDILLEICSVNVPPLNLSVALQIICSVETSLGRKETCRFLLPHVKRDASCKSGRSTVTLIGISRCMKHYGITATHLKVE
jgi:hypothetical protein